MGYRQYLAYLLCFYIFIQVQADLMGHGHLKLYELVRTLVHFFAEQYLLDRPDVLANDLCFTILS